MPGLLTNSYHYIGEPISGEFTITSETEDLSAAQVGLIVKKEYTDTDSESLAHLLIGSGLDIVSLATNEMTLSYKIPGSATTSLQPNSPVDRLAEVYYEIYAIYQGEVDPSVLEISTIRIDTLRVKDI